jgi:asparagine synthase (glutamine-hydrolysing)
VSIHPTRDESDRRPAILSTIRHDTGVCGIAAVHRLDGVPVDAAVLHRIMPCLSHRGPNGSGEQFLGETALGHWRLSILDTSDAGRQPMERSGIWLIHNGEIYNYLELGHELQRDGIELTTGTDTEVIIAAYRRWGLDAFSRFNGMWAMVLWDAGRRRLVASRDRLGVKPLYVRRSARSILIASEVTALVAAGTAEPGDTWRPSPNLSAVRDYLERGLVDHGTHTFVGGIEPLEPGTHLVVENGQARHVSYWSAPALSLDARPPSPATAGSDRHLVETWRDTFDDAVRLRLRSDVELGTCLSGGIDSSAIAMTVSILRGVGEDPASHEQIAQHAFHASFPSEAVDESSFARMVAQRAGLRLSYALPPADLWDRLERVIAAQGEPFASTSVMAQHLVMDEANRAGVRVLLDGQGADETLGGYLPYLGVRVGSALSGSGPKSAVREVRRQLHHHPTHAVIAGTVRALIGPNGRQILRRAAPGRWGIEIGPGLAEARSLARWHDLPGTLLARQLWQDVRSESLPALLRYEDRNSMAFGIEARVPFLDYRLVELSAAMPDRLRISGAWTKLTLRRAMAGRLPDAVTRRRDKMGFVVPEAAWMRRIRPIVERRLRSGAARELGWISEAEINRLLDHPEGNHEMLWRAVNASVWADRLS